MSKYCYKKTETRSFRSIARLFAILLSIIGVSTFIYIFYPLFLWQIFLVPAFASQNITFSIPKSTVVKSVEVNGLLTNINNNLKKVDYTNALNWFPDFQSQETKTNIPFYKLSIPKLSITNADVSTIDYNLSKHLVNYGETSIPPNKGNAVIFGHSTLPQLFNSKDYKTVFANLHTLNIGDTVIANISEISYTYKIFSINVVEPNDTSIFSQAYDQSYITLVTCTPPGTTWKRLIIKAKFESI